MPLVKDPLLPGHSDCQLVAFAEWIESDENRCVPLALGPAAPPPTDVRDPASWSAAAATHAASLTRDLAIFRREAERADLTARLQTLADEVARGPRPGLLSVAGLLSAELGDWLDTGFRALALLAAYHLPGARHRSRDEANAVWTSLTAHCEVRLPAMTGFEWIAALARWNDDARQPARIQRSIVAARRVAAAAADAHAWSAVERARLEAEWRARLVAARGDVLRAVVPALRSRADELWAQVSLLEQRLGGLVERLRSEQDAHARAASERASALESVADRQAAIERARTVEQGLAEQATNALERDSQLGVAVSELQSELGRKQVELQATVAAIAEAAQKGELADDAWSRLQIVEDELLGLVDRVVELSEERARVAVDIFTARMGALPARVETLRLEVELRVLEVRVAEWDRVLQRLDEVIAALTAEATFLRDGLDDVRAMLGARN